MEASVKKVILVGGSGGLGTALSTNLIERKVKIINISRSESSLPVLTIKTDLTNNDEIANAITKIHADHTDADVLILSPGVLHRHAIGSHSSSEIDADFSVNILGDIKIADGMIDIIKKNKGDIVIVGSTSSFISSDDSSVYVSAKHAVLGYIKSLQLAMKKENVRVIGFHPGGFQSEFHIKAKSDLKQEDLMSADELAKLIISFLDLPRTMEVSEIIVNRKKPN